MVSQTEFSLRPRPRGCHLVTDEILAQLPPLPRAGLLHLFLQHTSAALTINENADPDVQHDLLLGLREAFPDRREFRHAEGNSAAHLKSSCIGASKLVLIENGHLLLGTWQGIYFCEFDGPRTRRFYVKVLADSSIE